MHIQSIYLPYIQEKRILSNSFSFFPWKRRETPCYLHSLYSESVESVTVQTVSVDFSDRRILSRYTRIHTFPRFKCSFRRDRNTYRFSQMSCFVNIREKNTHRKKLNHMLEIQALDYVFIWCKKILNLKEKNLWQNHTLQYDRWECIHENTFDFDVLAQKWIRWNDKKPFVFLPLSSC